MAARTAKLAKRMETTMIRRNEDVIVFGAVQAGVWLKWRMGRRGNMAFSFLCGKVFKGIAYILNYAMDPGDCLDEHHRVGGQERFYPNNDAVNYLVNSIATNHVI